MNYSPSSELTYTVQLYEDLNKHRYFYLNKVNYKMKYILMETPIPMGSKSEIALILNCTEYGMALYSDNISLFSINLENRRDVLLENPHNGALICCAPTSNYPAIEVPHFVTAGTNGEVCLWNSNNCNVKCKFMPRSSPITSVAANSSEGSKQCVAIGYDDGTIVLWDFLNNKQDRVYLAHEDAVLCLKFSYVTRGNRNDLYLFSGGEDDCCISWTMEKKTPNLKYHHPRGVTALAVATRDIASLLATACEDYAIRMWDSDSGVMLRYLDGHLDLVTGLDFWQGHEVLLFSSSEDTSVRVWDALTGEAVVTLVGHSEGVIAVGVVHFPSPVVASYSKDGCICQWNLERIIEDFYRSNFLCMSYDLGMRNSKSAYNPPVNYFNSNKKKKKKKKPLPTLEVAKEDAAENLIQITSGQLINDDKSIKKEIIATKKTENLNNYDAYSAEEKMTELLPRQPSLKNVVTSPIAVSSIGRISSAESDEKTEKTTKADQNTVKNVLHQSVSSDGNSKSKEVDAKTQLKLDKKLKKERDIQEKLLRKKQRAELREKQRQRREKRALKAQMSKKMEVKSVGGSNLQEKEDDDDDDDDDDEEEEDSEEEDSEEERQERLEAMKGPKGQKRLSVAAVNKSLAPPERRMSTMQQLSNAIGLGKFVNLPDDDDDDDEEEEDEERCESEDASSQSVKGAKISSGTPTKVVSMPLENNRKMSTMRRLSQVLGLGRLLNVAGGSKDDKTGAKITPIGISDTTSSRDSFTITKQFVAAEEGRKFDEQARKQRSTQLLMQRLTQRNNTSSANANPSSITTANNEISSVAQNTSSISNEQQRQVHEKMKEHHSQDARRKQSVMRVKQNSQELLQKRLTKMNKKKSQTAGDAERAGATDDGMGKFSGNVPMKSLDSFHFSEGEEDDDDDDDDDDEVERENENRNKGERVMANVRQSSDTWINAKPSPAESAGFKALQSSSSMNALNISDSDEE